MENADSLRAEAYRLYQAGDFAATERACQALLQASPDNPDANFLLGAMAQRAGRFEEAAAFYGRAAALAPANATIVNAHGEACLALGRHDEAMACFARARDSRPSYERAHNNLGRLYHLRGERRAARACFTEAIRLNPKYTTAHNNLGAVFQAEGDMAAAAACYRQALALDPSYAEAHFNLGTCLQSIGDPVAAAAEFREAIRIRPEYARAHNHLGQALKCLRRDYDALDCFRTAARLQPNYADAQLELGCMLLAKQDWPEALEAIEHAFNLEPGKPEPSARLGQARQVTCDWRAYDSDSDRLWSDVERQIAAGQVPSVSPFQALTLPWSLPRLLAVARSHCNIEAIRQRKHGWRPTHPREAAGRLRVGYLSADYCDHPIAHLLYGLFERHDRSRFEVFAYSFGPADGSAYRQRIIAGCEHFVEVGPLSTLDLARRVDADGIHILVDLMGHTGIHRLGVFALRPAPIQVNFLGMLGTMGGDYFDFIIGDQFVTPPEFAEHFSEKFVTMPHSYLIAEPEASLPDTPIERREHGLPEKAFVFCSFNSSYKLEPRIFSAWMRILNEVPESVLWLFSAGPRITDNLCREATARGVAPERLVFAPYVPRPQHLPRHRAADLFLDTLVYNAAATSSVALQMGLPVLTCLGDTFASRVGASLLHSVGLPELVAPSLEEYQRLAIDLARRPEALTILREKLAAGRAAAPLFDTARFVRNLERAFEAMWDNHARGRPPESIKIAEPDPPNQRERRTEPEAKATDGRSEPEA